MKTVRNLLESNAIIHYELPFKNSFLIGDNASAKTFILESTIHINKNLTNCYYISVHNRSINIDNADFLPSLNINTANFISTFNINSGVLRKLLNKRLESTLLEKEQDLWVDNSLGTILFAKLFLSKSFNYLIGDFFESYIHIDIKEYDFSSKKEILINNVKHETLSNGISSIIRLLIEIEIAKILGSEIIFIDEIEKYLDTNNSYKLILFIQNRYKELQFIISTHSDDIIAGGDDFNIISIINNSNDVNLKEVEIYNSNDFTSSFDVKRKFFQLPENKKYLSLFDTVDNLYTNLIMQRGISPSDQKIFEEIKANYSKLPEKVKNVIDEIDCLIRS